MWDVGIAKMIKERDNKSRIGPCIGKVVSVNPLKISTSDGNIVLQEDQLYIVESLLEKEYKFTLNANDQVGDITITSEPSNSLVGININDKEKSKINLYFNLNPNDEVLLIPAENEQVFFILEKVKKVGG